MKLQIKFNNLTPSWEFSGSQEALNILRQLASSISWCWLPRSRGDSLILKDQATGRAVVVQFGHHCYTVKEVQVFTYVGNLYLNGNIIPVTAWLSEYLVALQEYFLRVKINYQLPLTGMPETIQLPGASWTLANAGNFFTFVKNQ